MNIYATIGQKFSLSLSDIYEILCGISDEQLNVAYQAEQEMKAAQGCRSTFSILLVIIIKLHSHIMYDEYIRF